MSKAGSTEPTGVAALERGLAILRAFRNDADTLSLAELAAQTGFYKSTILRLCASLMRTGFLQRLDTGAYRLGPALFELGRIYQRSFHLSDAVTPVLRDLVAETGESASLYIREGGDEICLHRVESPRPVRDAGIAEGDRFPIDHSACSMVLSAFNGAAGSDYAAIRRDLVVVSRQSKRVSGVAAIVAPVFGLGQKLIGVLLLSGPESRFTDTSVAALRAAVLRHAARLTRLLGGDALALEAVLAHGS